MTSTPNITIRPFLPLDQPQVTDLILTIQNTEFGVGCPITDQPDLLEIPTWYQADKGQFWVAVTGQDEVVGTLALKQISPSQGALRKMFVKKEWRGPMYSIAPELLATLLTHAARQQFTNVYLGTTALYKAAHRFYEKHGFTEIRKTDLPSEFPIMQVDSKFYRYDIS